MCIYNHPRDDCCITSSGSTNGLKVERLILWSKQRWAVHWAASATPHPPPHSTNQTVGWLITPPPLPSAHRWDVRLKVDGEQRCVWCYTPSYRLEFGLQTARPPPHPLHLYPAAARDLYPSGILPPPPMPFVTAGPCWRLPLKKKKKNGWRDFHSDFEWFMKCRWVLTVLWFLQCFARGISKSLKLSEQTTVGRSVSHLQLSALYHSSWSHLCVS